MQKHRGLYPADQPAGKKFQLSSWQDSPAVIGDAVGLARGVAAAFSEKRLKRSAPRADSDSLFIPEAT